MLTRAAILSTLANGPMVAASSGIAVDANHQFLYLVRLITFQSPKSMLGMFLDNPVKSGSENDSIGTYSLKQGNSMSEAQESVS